MTHDFHKITLIVAYFLIVFTESSGQSTQNLVGYYPFEGCSLIDDSVSDGKAVFNSNGADPSCACGVEGDALSFNGSQDNLLFLGKVNNQFGTTDFTLSFYFKPYAKSGIMDILSKRSACDDSPGLSIRYKSNSGELLVQAIENETKRVDFTIKVDRENCWHHVALVRDGKEIRLYYNAVLKARKETSSRMNFKNSGALKIAQGPCLGVTDTPFKGLIDEFRVYNRALAGKKIKELYVSPDKIINQDTIIYLGESVPLFTNSPCGIVYRWMPDSEINDAQIANPVVMPSQTRTYSFQVNNGQCIASDSITIKVIDPNEVDCQQLLFPTAFTPNHDGLNETFSFDTPMIVLDKFKVLEIFDRWGNRVFYTENADERWDGRFAGKEVNSGVFLYRVQFVCHGEEQNQVGQVTLIR